MSVAFEPESISKLPGSGSDFSLGLVTLKENIYRLKITAKIQSQSLIRLFKILCTLAYITVWVFSVECNTLESL